MMIRQHLDTLISAGRFGPDAFGPAPVVTDAGHTRSFEETYAWIKPLLRRVPITRVANSTPIDFLDLPVWNAVTPTAKDLTVHAGKGRHSLAARLSAIMEAIERKCAESVAPERILKATYQDLVSDPRGCMPVDPEDFDLPFATRYTPDLPISWVAGYDLMHRSHSWVPLDLAISPAEEGICFGSESNGLASGNGYTEAAVHALYEVLERDAMSEEYFFDRFGDPTDPQVPHVKMMDMDTLPADSAAFVERLRERGLDVVARNISNDVGVFVFSALLFDANVAPGLGIKHFAGYGASLHARHAMFRAVTEAVQAHTVFSVGSRDTYEMTWADRRLASNLRAFSKLQPHSLSKFPTSAEPDFTELSEELDAILEKLEQVGLNRCLVVDLTRADLEVPVIRVLVPGLSHYHNSARRPALRILKRLVP
jgi:YcaO-like protein with predicted kinase domain